MIMYDFKCHECGAEYEKLMRKDGTPKCKECGSEKNQERLLKVGHVFCKDDDSPKTQRDLANYLGNGQYVKGYRRE